MTTVKELHEQAMDIAYEASALRDFGGSESAERAGELFSEALEYEREAAFLVPDSDRAEPTRSILFRSAASLALQAGLYNEAFSLVGHGMSGKPSPKLLKDFLDVIDDIKQAQSVNLYRSGIGGSDILLSLLGDAIGVGQTPYRELKNRVESLKKLSDRTVARFMGREYQTRGRQGRMYSLFEHHLVSVSPQRSFAINYRLVKKEDVQGSVLVSDAYQIVDEIVLGAHLLYSGEYGELRNRINNDAYYTNFVTLVKDIAPDGSNITHVSLISQNNSAKIDQPRNEIGVILPKSGEIKDQRDLDDIDVVGKVGGVDDMESSPINFVAFETKEKKQYKIRMMEGIDDIMDNYWKRTVRVTGKYDGKYIYLTNIEEETDE